MKHNFISSRSDDANPVILTCSLLEQSGMVKHGFSTRLGGVSSKPYNSLNLGLRTEDSFNNVKENYKRLCKAVGVDEKKLILTRQVHSRDIKIVTNKDRGKGLEAESDLGKLDGLITAERGLPIAVFYADCTPILLLDPVKKVVAAVHSGWRGTMQRIARHAVQIMQREFSSKPEDILAAFGPSIKQCCFEVDSDVYIEFCQMFGARALYGTPTKNGKYYVNTDKLNKEQLIAAGLKEKNIAVCEECTFCNNDVYFSHRADGGKTGRMCAVIELI